MIRILGSGPDSPTPMIDIELGHGQDPVLELAARGYRGDLVAVLRPRPGDLTIRYAVEPLGEPVPVPQEQGPGPDSDAPTAAVGEVHRHQRLAAYVVARSTWGILLTQLSERTFVPGQWNLPGGGLEPDEEPVEGLVREVAEETSQWIEDVQLLTVLTRRWIGVNTNGRHEDLHAVRIFYTARCPEPSVPVVHDVGGSTAAARWTSVDEIARLPLASSVWDALAAAEVVGPAPPASS